jgi:hypothetical protein
VKTAESRWETDLYHWSPWTGGEGINAYIRRRRDEGWIYQGQVKEEGATIVLQFTRLRNSEGSGGPALADPGDAA